MPSKILLPRISQFSESDYGSHVSISTTSFGPHHMVPTWKRLFHPSKLPKLIAFCFLIYLFLISWLILVIWSKFSYLLILNLAASLSKMERTSISCAVLHDDFDGPCISIAILHSHPGMCVYYTNSSYLIIGNFFNNDLEKMIISFHVPPNW